MVRDNHGRREPDGVHEPDKLNHPDHTYPPVHAYHPEHSEEAFEKWVQRNLRELPVEPGGPYVEKSLKSLLISLHEERNRHKKRKWLTRTLEVAGGLAACFLLFFSLPQLEGWPRRESVQQPAQVPEQTLQSPAQGLEEQSTFAIQESPDARTPQISPEEEFADGKHEGADGKVSEGQVTETFENGAFRVEVPVPLIVGKRFTVSGQARVFEAAFQYEVEDGHNVLASGYVMATQGAPEWGDFALEVELESAPTNPYGTLILFLSSPRDGSRESQLNIPLQFEEDQVVPLSGSS